MWRIWRAPNNANKWQMGFNLTFKGLRLYEIDKNITGGKIFPLCHSGL
jgi:hypothetical protein